LNFYPSKTQKEPPWHKTCFNVSLIAQNNRSTVSDKGAIPKKARYAVYPNSPPRLGPGDAVVNPILTKFCSFIALL